MPASPKTGEAGALRFVEGKFRRQKATEVAIFFRQGLLKSKKPCYNGSETDAIWRFIRFFIPFPGRWEQTAPHWRTVRSGEKVPPLKESCAWERVGFQEKAD
ncbi:hypothetical protein [Oscillibacter sp. GMB15532]|uniref:hypothetical protein n=1 Tax=Oscillibacter sp. GMB15532 TaxID=3230022 RepID=UPI0034DE85C2